MIISENRHSTFPDHALASAGALPAIAISEALEILPDFEGFSYVRGDRHSCGNRDGTRAAGWKFLTATRS
jgi:hypothetical protein